MRGCMRNACSWVGKEGRVVLTRAFWDRVWYRLTVSGTGMEIEYTRLQGQVAYINDRFADKRSAQYWQFVIWARQVL